MTFPANLAAQGSRWSRRAGAALSLLLATSVTSLSGSEAVKPGGPAAEALLELRKFSTTGRVLHIAAHPDDENTLLIAHLSRGRGYDTAYLSITRGDGGQNLLGADFDEKLGVARTQELLAARNIDGGRQFFTRAIDFGFSKDADETLSIWNHQEVLGDVVRVIRRFQPDVIVTRFPIPPGSGGHGHHTASAILAVEAFKLAGDPTAFPEQLKQGVDTWQPKRVVWNGFSRGGAVTLGGRPSIRIDIAGNDPVTGEPFRNIAARSRAMHKTQALGDFGSRAGSGPAVETFVHLGGEPAAEDLMDGVDTGWSRIAGGEEIGGLAKNALESFKPDDPGASVPALLAIRRILLGLKPGTIVADKRAQLDRILQLCLGIEVTSRAAGLTVVPGETIDVKATARASASLPVRWVSVEHDGGTRQVGRDLSPQGSTHGITYPVPRGTPVSQPYWLREPGSAGMYRVGDPALIGMPVSPPALPLRYVFSVDGQSLVVTNELTYHDPGRKGVAARHTGPVDTGYVLSDEDELPVVVVPRAAVRFAPGPAVLRPEATAVVQLTVIAARPNTSGTARLEVPPGWRVSPPQQFSIPAELGSAQLAFNVTAPGGTTAAAIAACAVVDGEEWKVDATTLHYPHIPVQLLQSPARKKVVSVDVHTRGSEVGYLPGAGDDIPDALAQLGYRVTVLRSEDLVPAKLGRFDAIVIGVRAFNTRADLAPLMPALFSYVEAGGTIVAQYNWERNLKFEQIAPYRLRLSGGRVTNENAPVTFLVPDHPALSSPNRITQADFEGWVQERGVYFPSEWGGEFVPLLSMSDPGEPPHKGALLVARHGKGRFVYTGLAFFRQLPAGVPGAYRLFANLVSLGK